MRVEIVFLGLFCHAFLRSSFDEQAFWNRTDQKAPKYYNYSRYRFRQISCNAYSVLIPEYQNTPNQVSLGSMSQIASAKIIGELETELKRLELEARLKSILPTRALVDDSGDGSVIEIAGRKVVNFASWDVLGIARNRQVQRRIQECIEESSTVGGNTRTMGGSAVELINAEGRLAQFLNTESALLFSSRNQAILSLISALVSEQDLFIVDSTSQTPAVDAAFLTDGQIATYPWGDLAKLERVLERTASLRRKFLFVESLCPLTGRLAPLPQLLAVAARFDTLVIVDESFALTSVGLRGAGGCEISACSKSVFAICGDLARGFGAFGGFIAADAAVCGYLVNRSSTYSNEISPPSYLGAAVIAATDYVETALGARERIAALVTELRLLLEELGVLAASGKELSSGVAPGIASQGGQATAVVSIPSENSTKANLVASLLLKRGYLIEPCVIKGGLGYSGALRIIVNANHNRAQLLGVAQALASASDEVAG